MSAARAAEWLTLVADVGVGGDRLATNLSRARARFLLDNDPELRGFTFGAFPLTVEDVA